MNDYFYIAVRADLSIADQGCQIAHAACDAGREFKIHNLCNVVILQVENREKLFEFAADLYINKISCVTQSELDDERKETAIATAMVTGEQRKHFKKYKLWAPPSECVFCGVPNDSAS
jgi:hypothetical protein